MSRAGVRGIRRRRTLRARLLVITVGLIVEIRGLFLVTGTGRTFLSARGIKADGVFEG
jgi:hypothetical protein